MKITPEIEAEYTELRMKKNKIDANIRRICAAHIAMAVFLFVSSMFATAATSTSAAHSGPAKWFYGITAGFWMIIIAVATILLSVVAAAKHRLPSYALILMYAGIIVWKLTGHELAGSLMLPAVALVGIGLNIWDQILFSQDEALKEHPGYPLFNPRASFPAEYEPSPVVAAHKSSDHMDSIGGPQAAQPAPAAVQQTAPSADIRIDDMTAGSKPGRAVSEAQLAQPEGIALEGMQAAAQTARQQETALSPEGILSAMDSPSHFYPQGDAGALPDPDEVRARLAKMKADRGTAGTVQSGES